MAEGNHPDNAGIRRGIGVIVLGMSIGQTSDQCWLLLIISHLEHKIIYFLSALGSEKGV